jgi:hypothetical protein
MTINTRIEEITPSAAKRYLADRPRNRPIRDAKVQLFSSQMDDGAWSLNGESIIIGSSGRVIDGQHRLTAVIRHGKPVRFVVVEGVPDSEIETIDTGAARTAADVLRMNGLSADAARTLATSVNMVIGFELSESGQYSVSKRHLSRVTPKAIYEWTSKNPSIVDSCAFLSRMPKAGRVLPLGVLTFLHYLTAKIDRYAANEYFEGLMTGANLDELDPRLVLRTRLQKESMSHRPAPMKTRIAWAIKSIKWFLEGREARHAGNMCKVNSQDVASSYLWLKRSVG